jgi:hypothetical protein
MNCTRFGVVPDPDMGTTGITFTVTTPGSPTTEALYELTVPAGNVIPAGSYVTFTAPSGRTSIYWFEVDGVGPEPSGFPNSLIQKVVISAADTATNVVAAIQSVVTLQVQVPDMRGLFPRGWDNGRGIDPDAATRLTANSLDGNSTISIVGDFPGSVQEDTLQDHTHTAINNGKFVLDFAGGNVNENEDPGGSSNRSPNTDTVDTTTADVSTETRPTNMYFGFIIKT